MVEFVSYLRVSTGNQSLGIEAQREAVACFLASHNGEQLQEFVEHETGKGAKALDKRPQLKAALSLAKKYKAKLLIAKLDRLSRNVHFISGLMETGVEFVACDMPNADRFQLHLFAALAEKERDMISDRTKAGLQVIKDKLARGEEHVSKSGRIVGQLGAHGRVLAERRKGEAVQRLEPLRERLLSLRADGVSMRKMADILNGEGIPTPGGARWSYTLVNRALARVA